MRRVLLVAFALLGCDTRETMEARARFEITRGNGDIAEAERVAAAGGDPTFACRAVRQMIAGLESEDGESQGDAVARGRRTCRELSLAFARTRVDKLEAVRPGTGKAGGRERLAAECIELGRAVALARELREPHDGGRGDDPEVEALDLRRKQLCP
jgi:hypothetical protein